MVFWLSLTRTSGSVSNVYGKDQKETFFNNFNLHLIFRINDPTTAEFLSKAFGEREVIKSSPAVR